MRKIYETTAEQRRANYARRVAEGRDSATNRYRTDPDYKAKRLQQNLDCQRLRNFGLTREAFHEMRIAQNGRCAICKEPEGDTSLDVDHDHETGVVRGLLCRSCNLGLGKFKDNPYLLEVASQYLVQNNKKSEVIDDDLDARCAVRSV